MSHVRDQHSWPEAVDGRDVSVERRLHVWRPACGVTFHPSTIQRSRQYPSNGHLFAGASASSKTRPDDTLGTTRQASSKARARKLELNPRYSYNNMANPTIQDSMTNASALTVPFETITSLNQQSGTAELPYAKWPEEQKALEIIGKLRRSLTVMLHTLRRVANSDISRNFKNELLLCELALDCTTTSLLTRVHVARRHTRFREVWDYVKDQQHDHNLPRRFEMLQLIHQEGEKEIRAAFTSSWTDVYQHYLHLRRYQEIFGLLPRTVLKSVHRAFIRPPTDSFREIKHMLFVWYEDRPGMTSAVTQLHVSGLSIYRIARKIYPNAVLTPLGYYGSTGLYTPKLFFTVRKVVDSFAIVRELLSWLHVAAASWPSNKARGGDRQILDNGNGGYDARALGTGPQRSSRNQSEQLESPRYLPDGDRGGNLSSPSHVKRLPQTLWPKVPHFQSNVPSADSKNKSSVSKPKAAGFHTSTNGKRASDAASIKLVDQAGSPLGFHIPLAKMQESMRAPRDSRSAYWQYTLYQGPRGERVKVHYCKSLETMERISKLFLNESVIGFDIEWKPLATVKDGIRKNVATIQVASEERIALFHIARFSKGDEIEDLVAPSFKQIMESASITKVGVSVKSDCTRLRKFMDIGSHGLFELSHLYKLVKFASNDVKKINKKLVSLATQVEEHLMLPMYKDQNVRSSDWSEELDCEQIYYAASDSYAGFQLYHILNNKRLSMTPSPPLPAHADLGLPIRLANGQTVAEHEDLVTEEPPPETTNTPLPATEQVAEDLLNLEIEDKSSAANEQSNATAVAKKPPASSSSLSSHPSILAAKEWVDKYRASAAILTPYKPTTDLSYPVLPSPPSLPLPSTTLENNNKPRATPAFLRAYFLFHHHQLSISDIASL
ncbi:MAG: hypothetical protein Q9170_007982, partial [Blastenia crenularia]